jgi:hypothetical protein
MNSDLRGLSIPNRLLQPGVQIDGLDPCVFAHHSRFYNSQLTPSYFNIIPQKMNLIVPRGGHRRDTERFLQILQSAPYGPYVHGGILSFYDRASRTFWHSNCPSVTNCAHTWSHFFKAPKGGKFTSLAYFATPNQPENADSGWHAWSVALIRRQYGPGKILIFWDSDAWDLRYYNVPNRISQLIAMAQREGRIDEVWYNQNRDFCGDGDCSFHALDWIGRMVLEGDLPWQGPEEDPRISRCERIFLR